MPDLKLIAKKKKIFEFMNDITVLIPTSPIPSHPSTAILDETIANIRKYTNAKIIIMFDGVHKSLNHRIDDYISYRHEVDRKIYEGEYGNCISIVFAVHNHQAMMTRYILGKYVETPLIMFCEHDTSPIGDIPFEDVCECVKLSEIINYIRFNIFEKIPAEHQYLMLGLEPEMHYQKIIGGQVSTPLMLTRTIQWSQRPHVAKTEWYKFILKNYFDKTPVSMIEDVMHSVVQTSFSELGHDKFGLAIYTPEGNQLRSYHADGRGDDEKIILG